MEHNFWWLEPVGVLATAVATIALVWITRVLARETKRLAEIGQQPQIVFTIEPSEVEISFLESTIENTGNASAFDIRIEFDPRIEIVDAQGDTRPPIDKISVLKPGQKISNFLCTYGELKTRSFSVTTSWRRAPKSEIVESLSYKINLAELEGLLRMSGPDKARSLEKIAKALENLDSGFKKLKVDVFTARDREHEYRVIQERRAAREKAKSAPPK